MCHTEHISLEPSPLNQFLFIYLKNTLLIVVVQLFMEPVKTGTGMGQNWSETSKAGQNRSKTSQNRPVPYGTGHFRSEMLI